MEWQEFILWCIFLALLYAKCTVGIILNIFIVATNIHNWRTQKMLPSCDKILICLATSRCLLLFHVMVVYFFGLFFLQLLRNVALVSSLLVITLLLNHTNLWFASILCVFYCVKITNYNNWFFVILKTRISSLIHWFILASVAISIGCSVPFGWNVVDIGLLEYTYDSDKNMTVTKGVQYKNTQNEYLILLVGSLPPFLIFCVAIFLLIHSLWMHIRRMRGSGTGFGSPNLEVHLCAVKSMTLFLVLQVVYFTCMNLQMSPSPNISNAWRVFIFIIICSPPFLHSLYIIFSTKKLKETFLRWFCCC